jgi:hypothetical protein
VNPARFSRCIGCGADLKGTPLPARRMPSKVMKEVQKDSGMALEILTIIGGLGVVSFIPSCPNGIPMIISASAAFVGTAAWIVRVSRAPSSSGVPSCIQVLFFLLLCALALLFGIGILIGFACTE